MITAPTTKELKSLLNLWEQSVRKTHLFLAEGDIEFYRPFVNEFIPKLDLHVIRSASGQIEAFMGLSDDHIEMLFVLPSKRKNGLGSRRSTLPFMKREFAKWMSTSRIPML